MWNPLSSFGSTAMHGAWLLLAVAGLLEIVWAVALQQANGFQRPLPGAIAVVTAFTSFYMLSRAMRILPAGTAYAAWVGIGMVGVVVVGIIALGENASLPRLACLALVITGVVGLALLEGAV